MDFVDKKEQLADAIDAFIADDATKESLISLVEDLKSDADFKTKPLFMSIFHELSTLLPELSRKDLKQRSLMVRSFID